MVIESIIVNRSFVVGDNHKFIQRMTTNDYYNFLTMND